MDMINKGDTLTLDITDLNNLGCGVGHTSDGRAVFVKGAVSGDRVAAEVIKINKSFIVARLCQVISFSPTKIPSANDSVPAVFNVIESIKSYFL